MDGCHRDLALFVKERQPTTLKETTDIAQQYLEARGGTFKPPAPFRNTNPRVLPADAKRLPGKPSTPHPPDHPRQPQRQCFLCHKPGHFARECTKSFANQSVPLCYVCHKPGHLARNCSFNTQRVAGLVVQEYPSPPVFTQGYPTIPSHENYDTDPTVPDTNYWNFPPPGLVSNEPEVNPHTTATENIMQASCMVVKLPMSAPQECCMNESHDRVNLPCGHSLPMLSAACSENIVQKMPVVIGLVGDKKVNVLRDSGCSSAVIRKDLVQETQLTGEENTCVLIDGTVRKLPVATVNVNTPYFSGTIQALCMEKPIV